MKKINENELLNKVSKLREYIAVVESNQVNELNLGAVGTGAMNAVRGAGGAISNALSSTGAKVATGAALGAGALAAGQALTKPGQAAAPVGTTARVPGKPDPAVMKQQQDLIAKGAKIKADGIMGPATQAAIKQFAAAPQQTQTQQNFAAAGMAGQEMRTPAEIAASQDLLSANNAGNINAGKLPQTSMDDSDDANAKPFVQPAATAATAAPAIPQVSKPMAPAAPAAGTLTTSDGKPVTDGSGQPVKTGVGESVSFRNDELSRIVNLVQYR